MQVSCAVQLGSYPNCLYSQTYLYVFIFLSLCKYVYTKQNLYLYLNLPISFCLMNRYPLIEPFRAVNSTLNFKVLLGCQKYPILQFRVLFQSQNQTGNSQSKHTAH